MARQPRTAQLGRIKNTRDFLSNTNAYTGPGAFTLAKLFTGGVQGYWLDPSDFSVMYQDSGGTTPVTDANQTIGLIQDKSGRGNHFQQTTAPSRPVISSDTGGYLRAALDGIDDSWSSVASLDLSASDKVTVIAGVTKSSDTAAGIISEHTTNFNTNTGSFFLAGPSAAAASDFSASARGTAAGVVGQGCAVAGNAAPISKVLTAIHNIAGDSTVLRINGVQVGSGVSDKGLGNFANASHFIGARGGATVLFTGYIYQLFLINRLLTADELVLAEKFVASKMGIGL